MKLLRLIKTEALTIFLYAYDGEYIAGAYGKWLKRGHSITVPKRKLTRAHWRFVIKTKVRDLVDVVTRRNVYFSCDSTDCDGGYSLTASKYKNIFEANRSIDDAYDWADGPMYFNRITKEEYENFQSQHRDLGLEAFENGHSHVYRR